MKIYFDESGNSGCVLAKNNILNFREQPIFAVGAVVIDNDEDCKKLVGLYNEFKRKFNIKKEIKGAKLVRPSFNDAFEWLLENIFDNKHFYINLYDKKFYISTLLLHSLMDLNFKLKYPIFFYEQASLLSLQDDIFFVQYCNYISQPNTESFHDYLVFLYKYEYKLFEHHDNIIKKLSYQILSNHDESIFYDTFMTYGWYSDNKVTNLINLNALYELIDFIREESNYMKNDILLIHDNIPEFEDVFRKELNDVGINLVFSDSKKCEMLQLADNISSTVLIIFKKLINYFKNKKAWLESSRYDMYTACKLFNKISINNIKFTVPLHYWVITLCAAEMFKDYFLHQYRNKSVFDRLYERKLVEIKSGLLQRVTLINN